MGGGWKCRSGNVGSERIWKAGIVISADAFTYVCGLSMQLCTSAACSQRVGNYADAITAQSRCRSTYDIDGFTSHSVRLIAQTPLWSKLSTAIRGTRLATLIQTHDSRRAVITALYIWTVFHTRIFHSCTFSHPMIIKDQSLATGIDPITCSRSIGFLFL